MLCCISPFLLTAENGEKVLLNNTWSFGVGQVKLFDSYLSPFEFTGMGYRLDATHSAFYKGCDRRVSWSNWNHLGYANTYNPPYSAAINYLEGSIGYGSYYHFTPIKILILKVGGMVTAEAGI